MRLIDAVDLIGGGTPKTTMAEYWNGDIPWLSVKDFNNESRYVYSTEKTITETGLLNSSTKLLNLDDVIISARGTVGELAMIPFPMAFNQSCYGIRGKKDVINQSYLYYLLKDSVRLLKSQTHGSVFDTITRDTFTNIEIDLPSLDTQRTIAATLSALDDKIANNTAMNSTLEQMARAIFKSWFVDFEPWGGEQPTDWVNSSIGEVCDVKGGKRLPKGENLTTIPNEHPYIRVRDMNDSLFVQMTSSVEYVPREIQTGISRYIVSANDVIISIVGTIGLVCIVHPSLDKANLTENCVKLANRKGVSSSWLYLFLSSSEGQEKIRNVTVGAVQPKLPIKNIQSISFTLPPSTVMDEFDGVVTGLFETIANNYAENARLASLRDTLLPRLMSGELSVADLAEVTAK